MINTCMTKKYKFTDEHRKKLSIAAQKRTRSDPKIIEFEGVKYQSRRCDAIDAGDKQYFTNRTCKKGHLEPRLSKDGSCRSCRNDYQRKRAAELRELPYIQDYQRNYQAEYRLTEEGSKNIKKAQAKYNARKKAEREDATKS